MTFYLCRHSYVYIYSFGMDYMGQTEKQHTQLTVVDLCFLNYIPKKFLINLNASFLVLSAKGIKGW